MEDIIGNATVDTGISTPVENQVVTTPTESVKNETQSVDTSSNDVITREDFLKAAPLLRKRQAELQVESEENGTEVKEETKEEGTSEKKVDSEVKPTEEEKPVEPSTKVKLPDGEELTLEDIMNLKKGNMLQSDYTRKTQSLAEERKKLEGDLQEFQRLKELPIQDAMELWDSLGLDPIGTIEFLRQHYNEKGITEPKDPQVLEVEKKLVEEQNKSKKIQQDSDAKQQEETMKMFEEYMGGLATKYKDLGFDRDKVLDYCMTRGIMDPEVGFRAMMFDSLGNRDMELQEVKKKLEETEKKIESEKAAAVGEYLKDKVVSAATFVPPVGTGNSGTGISVDTPKGWQASRKAALARLGG